MNKSRLSAINHIFQQAASFESAWEASRAELQALLNADEFRLFKRDPKKSELFIQVPSESRSGEIRLPFSTASVAGYTALSCTPLVLNSLQTNVLEQVHPDLTYDLRYDKAIGLEVKNLISMPIQHERSLMGVLQVLNKRGGDFSREDEAFCRLIVNFMGRRLHEDSNLPKGPYENLVFRGLLTRERLVEAESLAVKRRQPLSWILRMEFGLDPDDIGHSLELYYQTPVVRFQGSPVSDQSLKGINRQYLLNNLWLPLQIADGLAVVLVPDPHDRDRIEEIRRVLNAKAYEFRVALPEDIRAFLGDSSFLPKDAQSGETIPEGRRSAYVEDEDDQAEEQDFEDTDDLGDSLADLEGVAEESLDVTRVEEEDISQESRQLAVQFVNKIIMHAHKIGASDVHIEPSRSGRPGVVRMRVDGSCERVLSVPESIIKPVVSRIKIMSNLNISEKRLPQDGKAKVRFKGRELELRVATLPTVHGESAVLRLLSSGKALPFEKLNLTDHNAEQIERLMRKPHGIFLVVGPTGSGKTTTLHSILARINTPDKKIWTVEDPVEITQPGLQQVQVESSIGLDFPRIMRAFLRADPDVILVGEMRDMQTAQIGVEASLTGHMVFSTLHTNSAPETVTRLLEMGVEAINFSEALQGILAQRLVKTLCPQCKESYAPSDEEWDYLVNHYGPESFPELGIERASARLHRAIGCPRCARTGYKGRTGIHELLVATPDVRRAIVRRQPAEEIARLAMDQGMRTLHQDGIYKIFKGDIDIYQLQKATIAD